MLYLCDTCKDTKIYRSFSTIEPCPDCKDCTAPPMETGLRSFMEAPGYKHMWSACANGGGILKRDWIFQANMLLTVKPFEVAEPGLLDLFKLWSQCRSLEEGEQDVSQIFVILSKDSFGDPTAGQVVLCVPVAQISGAVSFARRVLAITGVPVAVNISDFI